MKELFTNCSQFKLNMKSGDEASKAMDNDYKRPEAGAPPSEWQEWKKRKRERQTEWKEKKMAKKLKREEKAKEEVEERRKKKEEEEKRTEKEGRKWTLSVAVAGSIMGERMIVTNIEVHHAVMHRI